MNILLDSSALIEYYLGTPLGEKVRDLLNKSEIVFIPNIVFGETVSRIIRLGLDYASISSLVSKYAVPLDVPEYYIEAGKKHAELKKTMPRFSLADAIILTLAEKNKATIVTKDSHLSGPNTIML